RDVGADLPDNLAVAVAFALRVQGKPAPPPSVERLRELRERDPIAGAFAYVRFGAWDHAPEMDRGEIRDALDRALELVRRDAGHDLHVEAAIEVDRCLLAHAFDPDLEKKLAGFEQARRLANAGGLAADAREI